MLLVRGHTLKTRARWTFPEVCFTWLWNGNGLNYQEHSLSSAGFLMDTGTKNHVLAKQTQFSFIVIEKKNTYEIYPLKFLSVQYGIVNYKHNVISLISRTFSYCKNEAPSFLTLASGKHHFTFCFHRFDYYRYLTGVESKTILL